MGMLGGKSLSYRKMTLKQHQEGQPQTLTLLFCHLFQALEYLRCAANIFKSELPGWNPLNYNLLNFLKTTEKKVIDLTSGGNDEDLPLPPHLPRPNQRQGIKLLEEEWKSEGRIEKFKQLKSEMKTKE
jgi:hypothetical protein